MTVDADDDESATLSPDDAFAVLGNETRMEILHRLAAADGPLSFSALHDRVEMRDSGQFNYHLGKVEGHFVEKTDAGYSLRQAGRRVVEAVLSGAVTEAPEIEASRIDDPCPLCGGETVVSYAAGRVQHYCTVCDGHYGPPAAAQEADAEDVEAVAPSKSTEYGRLGAFQLPPAGLQGRNAGGVFRTAAIWGGLELRAVAAGICPRCTAPVEESVSVCEPHDATPSRCERCGNRHAIQTHLRCTNCLYEVWGAGMVSLLNDRQVLEFLVTHGINPVTPTSPGAYNDAVMDYEEAVESADPLRARITLSVDRETLTLVVEDDLTVVAVE